MFVHGELSPLWLLPMSSWVGTHPVPERRVIPHGRAAGMSVVTQQDDNVCNSCLARGQALTGTGKGCACEHVCVSVCVNAHTASTADLISHSSAMQAFSSTYTCCLTGFSLTHQLQICCCKRSSNQFEPCNAKFPLYIILKLTGVQLQVVSIA